MDEAREQLKKFTTTTVSDALDGLGIAGQCLGIKPLDGGFRVVSIGDARVSPGDLLLGDADGVIVVPAGFERKVVALAQEIDDAEARIRQAVEGGMRLDEARRQFKYFTLQRWGGNRA